MKCLSIEEKLARELFEIGIAGRRKYEKRDDGFGWDYVGAGQLAAWKAIGKYVAKHFRRKVKR